MRIRVRVSRRAAGGKYWSGRGNRSGCKPKTGAWLVAVLLLAFPVVNACTSATGYVRAAAPSGQGYSETQNADGTFEVRFRGNEPTSIERATDFALLRAATVALESECSHFAILAMVVGSSAQANQTRPEPGKVSMTRTKPTTTITISCIEDPSDDASAYHAEFVRDSVAAKYGLPGGQGDGAQ